MKDLSTIKALLEVLRGSDVSRLEWSEGGESITLELGRAAAAPPVVVAAPALPSMAPAAPVAVPVKAEPASNTFTVTSPFVGTFYRSPTPEKPAFIEVGATVQKGQVLCIVEAMKLMNEIESERAGRLVEILAQNGQAVEFGEPLFRFEPV